MELLEETPPLARGRLPTSTSPSGRSEKHPRLRGEDPRVSVFCASSSETPPLARGRRYARHGRLCRRWKHPRLRGEDAMQPCLPKGRWETPPLARGRPDSVRIARARDGNTPACAGKTNPCRLCMVMPLGNTPACAGKTATFLQHQATRRKHPRLRGEDVMLVAVLATLKETPPLARGRPREFRAIFSCVRNTPACAGKTWLVRPHRSRSSKHPRLRGEDGTKKKKVSRYKETPPLARGRPKGGRA